MALSSRTGGKFTPLYGFIIRKNDFGEGNSVFTAVDRELGKINFLSFGSCREKSSRRSCLLVTNLVSGVLFKKEKQDSEYSLKEVSTVKSYSLITANLTAVSYCYLLYEILNIVLGKDHPFGLFSLLSETMDEANADAPEKYFLRMIFRIFQSEGILPDPNESPLSLQEILGSKFALGNGSVRFLKDIFLAPSGLLKDKILSGSVLQNLLEFIRLVVGSQYHKELASLDLIIHH